MDSLHHLFWPHDKFLGITWSAWKIVGWMGNAVFSTRFLVQWYATEKRKQVVVPPLFWWLSLVGSLLLLFYAIFSDRNSVFIFAYCFTWIPYTRNLIINARHQKTLRACPDCGLSSPAVANYCARCGTKLDLAPVSQPQ